MDKNFDLIVVGGGFSGTCAAIEAARKGLSVLLVEKYNCLGGAPNNCLVMPFMNYWTKLGEGEQFLTGDLFLEIVENLRRMGGIGENNKTFDEEILKIVLQRMCIAAGANLLFNTTIVGVETENGKIVSIQGWGKSKMLTLTAKHFIDATGDAELSILAGVSYRVGREEDGLCQPMTLSFRLGGMDKQTFLMNRAYANALYKEHQEKGLIKNPRENVLIFVTQHDDIIHFNTTRIVKHDPTDPWQVTKAEIDAREQVFEMLKFLKENIPGCENAFLLSTALQIGIRESRMIEGEYTLTVEDLKSLKRFPDAIAVANYDIDIHNPEGAGTSHYYFGDGEWYEIPYRCLVPKGMKNLLVAGRCISSTHEAQASYRIMPYCAELGHAAGAAVSVAVKNGTDLPDVDMAELQTILKAEGFMIGQ